MADLTACVRTCADVCQATGRVLPRRTGHDAGVTRAVLEACVTVCRASGEECGRHAAHHEHCRVCAAVCPAVRAGLPRAAGLAGLSAVRPTAGGPHPPGGRPEP